MRVDIILAAHDDFHVRDVDLIWPYSRIALTPVVIIRSGEEVKNFQVSIEKEGEMPTAHVGEGPPRVDIAKTTRLGLASNRPHALSSSCSPS